MLYIYIDTQLTFKLTWPCLLLFTGLAGPCFLGESVKKLEPYKTVKPLHKLMIDRGMKWTDIGKGITIEPHWLYKIERGWVPPQYLIDRLCAFLKCDEDDIIGWEV